MGIANPWALNLLKSLEFFWLECSLLESDHFRGRVSDSTSHAVDEYFLRRSGWKSQGGNEGCQCIYMRILLTRYMVDVKVFEPLCHMDSCIMIGYQVFMSDFIFSVSLVDGELWITVCLEIFDSNLFRKLHPERCIFETLLKHGPLVRMHEGLHSYVGR